MDAEIIRDANLHEAVVATVDANLDQHDMADLVNVSDLSDSNLPEMLAEAGKWLRKWEYSPGEHTDSEGGFVWFPTEHGFRCSIK